MINASCVDRKILTNAGRFRRKFLFAHGPSELTLGVKKTFCWQSQVPHRQKNLYIFSQRDDRGAVDACVPKLWLRFGCCFSTTSCRRTRQPAHTHDEHFLSNSQPHLPAVPKRKRKALSVSKAT